MCIQPLERRFDRAQSHELAARLGAGRIIAQARPRAGGDGQAFADDRRAGARHGRSSRRADASDRRRRDRPCGRSTTLPSTHQPHLQVRPIESLPVLDRRCRSPARGSSGCRPAAIPDRPTLKSASRVSTTSMPTKASPTAANASSRPDGCLARCNIAHDMEGDLDLDADHVHGLAVETPGRGDQRTGQQRRGLGSAVGVRAPTFQPAPDRWLRRRRPGWHRPHRGPASRRAAASASRNGGPRAGPARRWRYRGSC